MHNLNSKNTPSRRRRQFAIAIPSTVQSAMIDLPVIRHQLETWKRRLRFQIATRLVNDGISQKRAAKAAGLSPSNFCLLRQRYKIEGDAVFEDKSHRAGRRSPSGKPRRSQPARLVLMLPNS